MACDVARVKVVVKFASFGSVALCWLDLLQGGLLGCVLAQLTTLHVVAIKSLSL